MAFAQIPFKRLTDIPRKKGKITGQVLRKGFQELQKVWHQLQGILPLKRFLIAFFFYAMGVQTVMLVAAAFGEKVLHLGASKLIITILLIQLVAIAGAYFISWLAGKIGNINVLIVLVTVWISICIGAYYIDSEV